MNENDMQTTEESVRAPMAPKMEEKEASTQPTGHDTYKDVLDSAGSYEESEVEGTFTVADGVITEEQVTKDSQGNRMLVEENAPVEETDDDRRDARVVGETDSGKQIQVAKDTVHSGYTIEFASGGQLPAELQGKWTSFDRAVEAVRVYLAKREQENTANTEA